MKVLVLPWAGAEVQEVNVPKDLYQMVVPLPTPPVYARMDLDVVPTVSSLSMPQAILSRNVIHIGGGNPHGPEVIAYWPASWLPAWGLEALRRAGKVPA